LYTMYPFNKTIWRKVRFVWWWLFFLIKIFPAFGISQMFVILLALIRDRRDEYQLVSFILEVKGTQFITQGILNAIIGGVQYYNCVNLSDAANAANPFVHTCSVNGPGSLSIFYVDMGLFALESFMAWIAFLFLPYSKKKGLRKLTPTSPRPHFLKMDEESGFEQDGQKPQQIKRNCCGCRMYDRRGGHLRGLLAYDVIIFLAAVAALIGGLWWRPYNVDQSGEFSDWEWKFRADMYWLRVLYAILSFPFMFFVLPVMDDVLMHVKPTAYNQSGDTVPRAKPVSSKSGVASSALEMTASVVVNP